MKGVMEDGNTSESVICKVPKILVVVSGDVDYPRSFAGFSKDFLNNVIMSLFPIPRLAKPPEIDDIADQVEVIRFRLPKKIQQHVGIAASGSEVNVRDPDGSKLQPRLVNDVH